MQTEKVEVSSLVFDHNLYPRFEIDDYCITDYARAMEAGAIFPPIIADRKSRRVVDGWKRGKAALKFSGDGAKIEVEWRDYKDEAAVLLDAISTNTIHGERISRYDLQRCAILGQQFGIREDLLAAAMRVTPDHLEQIRAKLRSTRAGDVIANKQVGAHLPLVVTVKQADGLKRSGGNNQAFFINQVINLIENNLLDTGSERVMERLAHLAAIIEPLVAEAA